MVEPSQHHPKAKGLRSAANSGTGKDTGAKNFLLELVHFEKVGKLVSWPIFSGQVIDAMESVNL